jgi:hypothetical protein
MIAVPKRASVEAVAEELPAAIAWAQRNELKIEHDRDELTVYLHLTGPAVTDGHIEHYLLRGRFDDYRAIAPEWVFVDPRTRGSVGDAAFPHAPAGGAFGASLFIQGNGGALICAHFNRLAYATDGGVHTDWGETTSWLTRRSGQTFAPNIGSMLDRISRDMPYTQGRKAPLPEL